MEKRNRQKFKIPQPKKKFVIPETDPEPAPSSSVPVPQPVVSFSTNLDQVQDDLQDFSENKGPDGSLEPETITKEQIRQEQASVAAEIAQQENTDEKPYVFPSLDLLAKPGKNK